MSHVTHMNKSYHVNESCHRPIWTSHVACMNESCHRSWQPQKQPHQNRRVCPDESCFTYEWAMSHMWLSHTIHGPWQSQTQACESRRICPNESHMNESRHTYEYVTSRVWKNRVKHMNTSHHTYRQVVLSECVTHINKSRVSNRQ